MSELPKKIIVWVTVSQRKFDGIQQFHPKLKMLLNSLHDLSVDDTCPYEFFLAVMVGGIARARNKMVHAFKLAHQENENVKWLLTLDDDIETNPDASDILRLLSHKRPLVGVLYTTREVEGVHWVTNFLHEVELQKNGLLQVLETGTGMKLHHINVFTELERILGDALSYTDRDTGERITGYYQQVVLKTDVRPDGDFLPEDYFFDHCCRHTKIGIFVDTTIKLKHRGPDGTLYPVGDWPPIPGLTEVAP
jgi:hypothetical protein